MKTWMICGVSLLAGACLFAVMADGHEEKNPGAGMQMPPWMQLGKEHEAMKKFVGEWKVTSKFMTPGGEMVTEGKSTGKSVLAGRFMHMDYNGSFMGQTWTGLWYMGYDSASGKYKSVWMDNMSPHMHSSEGTMKDGAIHMAGIAPGHDMKGTMTKGRSVMAWQDNDNWTLTFFTTMPDGTEAKMGGMSYARVK